MNILLYCPNLTIENSIYIKIFFDELSKYKAELFVLEKFIEDAKNKLKLPKKITTIKNLNDINKIDFLICFGGDGTMLKASHLIENLKTPIVGINTGRLGFLANIPKESIGNLIKDLFNKNYHISARSLINVTTKPK